jgi:hypothetical protein
MRESRSISSLRLLGKGADVTRVLTVVRGVCA